jgi:NAD(P)-dependent dehydrogenase (short-subunit alcohol dehydrogenase family)
MQCSLDGMASIVTGGGRGIDKVMALGFARAGPGTIVTSRSASQLHTVAAQIDYLVEATVDGIDSVGALVNSGATSYLAPLLEPKEKTWDSVFDVNCKGRFLSSRAVAKGVIEQGGGEMMNVTTVGAERGGVGMSVDQARRQP